MSYVHQNMEGTHEILGCTAHTMKGIGQNFEDTANNPERNDQNTVGTGHDMEGTGHYEGRGYIIGGTIRSTESRRIQD
jgi:hypothetical protein